MNQAVDSEKLLGHAVEELLEERKSLLALFCELAGMGESRTHAQPQPLLRRFCQLLIDYASLWQFEIHDLLLRSDGRHEKACRELEKLQPIIFEASDVALEFNDRYDDSDHPLDLSRMEAHLSKLGETLATRFDAEDRIISVI